MPYVNNKSTDQPAHPCPLINAFVIRCLDSITPLVSIAEISSLYLTSVAVKAGLSLTWSQTLKTGFLVTRLILAEPGHEKMCLMPYANNKGADQPAQGLCYSLLR